MKRILIFFTCMAVVLSVFHPIPVYAKSKIDIVFIIDRSGSMSGDITDVRNQVSGFADLLEQRGVDYRLGLLTYEKYVTKYDMTDDVETFKYNLGRVSTSGSIENGLDAIADAINGYVYDVNATKYFVLIGDEEIDSRKNYSDSQVINMLQANDVILTAVGISGNWSQFKSFSDATGGLILNLSSGFGENLGHIFDQIQAIPTLDVVSPVQGQILSEFDTPFVPTVIVSDPDSDTLYFELYLDSEATPRDTRTVTNTKTEQTVTLNAIDIATLTEGPHTFRFTVNDGSETVQDVVNVKVDKLPPVLGSVNISCTDTKVTISGSATDATAGMHSSPYRHTVGPYTSGWTANTSFTRSSLTPNTNYTVKFEARDKVGHISTRQEQIYTKAQIPSITIEQTEETSLAIRFADGNPSTTEYQIKAGTAYVSRSGTLTSTPEWVVPADKRITLTGLNPGTTYGLSAKARNRSGTETAFCTQVNGTTLALPPDNITVTPAKTSIEVSWDSVQGATGYDVEADGEVTYNGMSTVYVDGGLSPNTQHTYRVRVRNKGGTGNWSSLIAASTLPDPPAVPGNIQSVPSQSEITLSWDAIAHADGYDVLADGEIVDNGADTTFIHRGLDPDTQHTYRVRAKNPGGESEWSQPVTEITLPYPPDTPLNITTQITKDSVTLSWSEMERATGYEIEADGLIIDNGEQITYIHDGLEPLSGHTYRIRAKNRGGKSPWSAPVDVTTHPEKPNVPANIMGTAGENDITVVWYKVPHTESYQIEVDGIVVTGITDTQYRHSGLAPDSQHTYRVRALNISGISEWSSPLTVFTLPHIDQEEMNIALTNIVAVVTNNSITISWDAVAANVEYDVEVDGILKENGTQTILSHTALEPNTFHRYRIKVKNSEGLSKWCGVLALSTLQDPPDAPQGIEAFAGDYSIELRWERIEGAVGYDLEIDGQVLDGGQDTDYLHGGLEPGTAHTYRVRAKGITGVTAWSPAITVSTTNPTYTVECTYDKAFDFSLLASNVQDFTELKFVVTYNPDELEVTDLFSFTPGEDVITQGRIAGSDIYVTYTPGRIEITVDKSIVPGTSWSGEISAIVFRSKIDGLTEINFIVQ